MRRTMAQLAGYRYELRHCDAALGVIRAGGIDLISEALNDEAFFWFGWRGLEHHVRESNRMSHRAPAAWLAEALRHSALAAAASTSRGQGPADNRPEAADRSSV